MQPLKNLMQLWKVNCYFSRVRVRVDFLLDQFPCFLSLNIWRRENLHRFFFFSLALACFTSQSNKFIAIVDVTQSAVKQLNIVDLKNGRYRVSFVANMFGDFLMHVKISGNSEREDVEGSPFLLQIFDCRFF